MALMVFASMEQAERVAARLKAEDNLEQRGYVVESEAVVLHSTVTFANGKTTVTSEMHGIALSRTRQGDKEYYYLDNESVWR